MDIKMGLLIATFVLPFPAMSKEFKELSADQNKRGTSAKMFRKSDLDDNNTTTYRILRDTKWEGAKKKHYNLVNGITTFVISTSYYAQTPMYPVSHDCIFMVKGNLTLEQIKNGNIKHKDILNVDCTTYRRERKIHGSEK